MANIDLRIPQQQNFLNIEKDFEKISAKLLLNQNILKLIYYNDKNCLSKEDITSAEMLIDISKNNIRLSPNIDVPENKGSYVIVTFDHFTPNATNPKYMDNIIYFDVLCPRDKWQMDNYMFRPFHIMHEIQSEFDKQKLNGIGTMQFVKANLLNLGDYSGYQLGYLVINDV